MMMIKILLGAIALGLWINILAAWTHATAADRELCKDEAFMATIFTDVS